MQECSPGSLSKSFGLKEPLLLHLSRFVTLSQLPFPSMIRSKEGCVAAGRSWEEKPANCLGSEVRSAPISSGVGLGF